MARPKITLLGRALHLRIPAPQRFEFAQLYNKFALMIVQRKAEPFKSRKIYFAE